MPLGGSGQRLRFLNLSLRAHPPRSCARIWRSGYPDKRYLAHVEIRRLCARLGLITVRQRPGSANGVIFMTIEDETGIAKHTSFGPKCSSASDDRVGAATSPSGKMQEECGVIHVVADAR